MRISEIRVSPSAFAFIPVIRGENRLEVRNSGDTAEITLIGAIGKSWWDDSGITEQEFRNALKDIPKGKPVNVLVNSEGGSVKEGLGIYNAIKERNADVQVRITGYALSIASVFPLAAKRALGGRGVVSPKSAIWMEHKAWSWAQGNADDMRQAAEMLDTHDETMVDIYAEATGKSKAEIRSRMEKETWTKGGDAIAAGLADETDEEENDDSQASYRPLPKDYLTRCKAPAHILNALSAAPKQGAVKTTNQPENKVMTRAQMVALLKSWGVEVLDTVTDDQLVAMIGKGKPAAATPAPAPVVAAGHDDPVARLEAQLLKERTARVTAEVNRRAENKIPNDKLAWWIARAMEDETGTFAQIEGLPAAHVGTEPLGLGRIEEGAQAQVPGFEGKCLERVQNMFKELPKHGSGAAGKMESAGDRHAVMKENWDVLMREALAKDDAWSKRHGVMPIAANTYSATLVTNFLILGAITQLSPQFAALKAFARDNSVDPYKPLASGIMKFNQTTQDGSKVQTDETNWETAGHSDSDVEPITIATHQYSSIMHVTNSELNSGLRMEDLTIAKLADLGSKVTQVATAPITAANFATLAPLISAPAAFGFSDMATLWGQLKKSSIRNLILDGEYLARIINNPTLFQSTPVIPGAGWKNVNGWGYVGLTTDWSGAGANIRGFACNPQAIGCLIGLPLNPPEGIPGNTLMTSVIQLPGVDVGIAVYVWFSLATRTLFASYDLVFGAAKLDGTAGVIVASGNPG